MENKRKSLIKKTKKKKKKKILNMEDGIMEHKGIL